MSDVVIQVDSLWKKYRLGVVGTGTLRHDFNRWLHRVVGKPAPYAIVGAPTKSEDRRAKSQSPSPLSFVNRLSSANALGRHMRPIRLPRGPFRTSISPGDERGGEEYTAETRAFA